MDALIVLSVFLFFLCSIFGCIHVYRHLVRKEEVTDYLEDSVFTDISTKNKKVSLIEKITKKVITYADDFSPIGQRINFFSEEHEVRSWLQKAGFPLDLTVEKFQGIKMFLAFVGMIIGVAFVILGMPLASVALVLFPIVGYFIPILLLKNRAKMRQDQLRYDLPDFLDTISVSLQAGVSLDQALREVVKFFDGPIHEEFSRFIQELDLGVQRETAYRNLLNRNDNPEFQTLIKSLIQGMQLGVPIATTFKIQANDMRVFRQEQVKEKAAKASPKITLITTFIVMPTSIFLIGGLMIMNMFMGDDSVLNLFNK